MSAGPGVDLVDRIMRYEAGELDEDETIALFDYLVSHGMIWGLQGSYQREAQRMIDEGLIKPFEYDYDGQVSDCRHCGRRITNEGGAWVDPEATGDDSVWRETCDAHGTFTAEHEPV